MIVDPVGYATLAAVAVVVDVPVIELVTIVIRIVIGIWFGVFVVAERADVTVMFVLGVHVSSFMNEGTP
jgi:hypothetical protein